MNMSVTSDHWFLERISSHGDRPSFVKAGQTVTHAQLADSARRWIQRLDAHGVHSGQVVVIEGDHAPQCFGLLLALALRKAIAVPLTTLPEQVLNMRCDMAHADWLITAPETDAPNFRRLAAAEAHPLLDQLRTDNRAGLMLFSSGSSGTPKTCLLDFDSLLETARTTRKSFVTLAFLLFDHIGGINTVISILGQGGTIVVPEDRSVATTARLVEQHAISLLPTSPTFLKLLLMSGAADTHDLSSLELITYGTEVMPQSTLDALRTAFPEARLKQTYGLSEIGIVPTRSRADGSLWLEIGGSDVEHEVRDGILWLRAPTAMLGYLNAASPFDSEGWLNTGDRVEVDGPYLRILGRDSELINIGGEKVHPAEVENVILDAPNVADVTVHARPNPVMGAVLTATVSLQEMENSKELKLRLGKYCRQYLEPHKVPMMFKIADGPLHSERFKKDRGALL